MTETKVSLARQSLKSPRAAAIAGILFAILYGISLGAHPYFNPR